MDFEAIIHEEYKHIDIEIGGYTIRTDQPVEKGGTGIGPTPGKLMLSAVASCTLATAYGYCHRNNLPLPTGMRAHVDGDDDFTKVQFEIQLPTDFPDDRIKAVQKAANACWVKKQWLNPPEFSYQIVKE
jgi:putative redox protein